MQIICGGKRQRDGERLGQEKKTQTLMWKYNETDERETEGGRGRQEEIKGDRRRNITLMI